MIGAHLLTCFTCALVVVAAVSQNSLYVTSKLAQITVERESGCLGLTLRGGADYPLIVTHVRLHGPVYKTGRIKPGDRLLRVDNVSIPSTMRWLTPARLTGASVCAISVNASLSLSLCLSLFRSRSLARRWPRRSRSLNAATFPATPILPLSTTSRSCRASSSQWGRCSSRSSDR